jgi:hypothetical protein
MVGSGSQYYEDVNRMASSFELASDSKQSHRILHLFLAKGSLLGDLGAAPARRKALLKHF